MAQVTITINSREYAVACEDGQEVRILQLARMLDEKAKMLTQASGQVNENMLLAMVGLLLADEPTGNLDSTNGAEVMELLRELNGQGTTIVMVTHSERDASFAHRIIHLLDGRVVS